jgi:ATP-dependent Clp protease adaptor protein ClpS
MLLFRPFVQSLPIFCDTVRDYASGVLMSTLTSSLLTGLLVRSSLNEERPYLGAHQGSLIFMGEHDDDADEATDVALAERTEEELHEPPKYQVILNNDDYTPMDFVVDVLQEIYKMSLEQAATVMLAVHHRGKGIAGVYPKEIAETKIELTHGRSQVAGYPLLCTMEAVGPEPGSGPRSPRMG